MGDIMVGLLVGTGAGALVHKLGIKIIAKTIWLQVFNSSGESENYDL